MASDALIPFLVGMMLLTGVCNTLLTKYQDQQCVRDCDGKHPEYFEQPVIQTAQMFVGEMGCWLVVGGISLYSRFVSDRRPTASVTYEPAPRESTDAPSPPSAADIETANDASDAASSDVPVTAVAHRRHPRVHLAGWRLTYLALPAICDIAGTTLMNVGLLFVAASIYQMTRGALVLFVGLFSVLFLNRHLALYKWLALFVVMAGVAIVGLAGAIVKDGSARGNAASLDPQTPLGDKHTFSGAVLARSALDAAETTDAALAVCTVIGVLLIAGAQVFTAAQFVLEESIMENYELEPLKVVGWEGVFGFAVTAVLVVLMHIAVGRSDAGRHGYFDAGEGLRQINHSSAIAISSVLIMFSIGGFNFFGLSVTRSVSATARATIDTCRTLFIWIVSLGLGWETFKWLQVLGFAMLVYGTFLFNDIVRPPLRAYVEWKRKKRSGINELLPEGPIEHL